MALLGVEKELWVTFPKSEKEKVAKAMDDSIKEIKMLREFAQDFKEGKMNRKEMIARLKSMENISLIDRTKAKMFLNASKYIHKIKDSKFCWRFESFRQIMEMVDGMIGMELDYEHRHTSELCGIKLHIIQVGAEKINYITHLQKTFKQYRVEGYEIYTKQEDSKL